MWTVPAHSLLAPTRAKLIAALRSIPGVCAVFASSWLPGMTRTPSCFQRSWECDSLMVAPSIQRGVDQVPEQVAKEDPLVRRLCHQQRKYVLDGIDEE